ncbi:MAG TPA: hypothetical protein VGP07_02610 [Polyangia bacterium]|jgi:hypothetical protein
MRRARGLSGRAGRPGLVGVVALLLAAPAARATPNGGGAGSTGVGGETAQADAGAPVDVGAPLAPSPPADDAGDGPVPTTAPPDSSVPAVVVVPSPRFPFTLRVLEKGTRKPLGGTAIAVDARPAGETDADGRLTVSLPAGPHQLEAQYPGHAVTHGRLNVTPTPSEELVLRLEPESTGERYQTEVRVKHDEVPRVTFDAVEARQTAGTSGDPLRVLASLPGVSQVVWPAAIFVVRGSNPGNTGFFIDGIRVPATFHLALGPSIIAPSLISGLDFYPGAYPDNFGRYIAGIVSIRTERPPEDRVHVAADVSLYESRAIVTAPLDDGRGVVAAAARYSYTGPLLSLFDSQTTLGYWDYQLRFDHTLGPGRLTLFSFGSYDRLDWNGGSVLGPGTQTAALQFHRLDVRWTGSFGGGRLVAGVTGGYDQAHSTLSEALLTVKAVDLAPRITWNRPLGRVFELEVGADAEYQHFAAQPDPSVQEGDLGRSRPAVSQGTYASLRLHPNESLGISAGMRTDLFVEEGTSRFVPEPRLDAQLRLSPRVALKANVGRFSQMPSLPLNVAGFESFGLASIGLQRSDGGSGGVDVRVGDDTTIDVTGFYQRMQVTDVTNLTTQGVNVTGDDYLVLHDGLGYGVETMIRRPPTHRLSGWISYTLSYSYRNGPNGVVRSDWDQRHILNVVGNYRVGSRTTVGARFHYNTGRDAPLPPRGRTQLPDYYQIDLRVERRFVFDRFIFDLYFDFANATINSELVQYVATSDGVQPSKLRVALPTLGIHGEF